MLKGFINILICNGDIRWQPVYRKLLEHGVCLCLWWEEGEDWAEGRTDRQTYLVCSGMWFLSSVLLLWPNLPNLGYHRQPPCQVPPSQPTQYPFSWKYFVMLTTWSWNELHQEYNWAHTHFQKNQCMVETVIWTRRRGDSQGVWDGHVHIDIFKTDNQKDLLYSTGNSA